MGQTLPTVQVVAPCVTQDGGSIPDSDSVDHPNRAEPSGQFGERVQARRGPLDDQEVPAVGDDAEPGPEPARVFERVVERQLRVARAPEDDNRAANLGEVGARTSAFIARLRSSCPGARAARRAALRGASVTAVASDTPGAEDRPAIPRAAGVAVAQRRHPAARPHCRRGQDQRPREARRRLDSGRRDEEQSANEVGTGSRETQGDEPTERVTGDKAGPSTSASSTAAATAAKSSCSCRAAAFAEPACPGRSTAITRWRRTRSGSSSTQFPDAPASPCRRRSGSPSPPA